MMNLLIKSRIRRMWSLTLCFTLLFTSICVNKVNAVGQLSQVNLSAGTYGLLVNETTQLTATGIMDDGTPVDLSGASISYSSNNTSIATVSSSGLVTGVSTGISRITAEVTLNGVMKSRSIAITVNSGTLFTEGFENGLSQWTSLYKGASQISSGQKHSGDNSFKLLTDYYVVKRDFNVTVNGVIQGWFYDDLEVNKSSMMGALSGLIAGPFNSASASYYVVRGSSNIVTTAARTKGWHQVAMDYTGDNVVTVYIDGTIVANVNGYQDFGGILLGDYWGDGSMSNMYYDDIGVYRIDSKLGKITSDSSAFNLKRGQTSQLTVNGVMEDGSNANLSGATKTYSSSNTSVATVNSSGLITAANTGNAVITTTVTLSGVVKTAVCNVEVFQSNIALAQLDLSCNRTSMKAVSPADTSKLVVKGLLSNGTIRDLNGFIGNTFTYSSSNTSVATVNTTGLITAVSNGVANIAVSVTMNGVQRTKSISIIVNKGTLFNEGFEAYLTSWTKPFGNAQISTAIKRNGSGSLKVQSDLEILQKAFPRTYKDIAEGWFYDDGAANKKSTIKVGSIQVGPYYDQSSTYYVLRYDSNFVTTTVPRNIGWHQVVFDYTAGGSSVNVYIDGVLVAGSLPYSSFDTISLGDWWSEGYISNLYCDDISIYTITDSSAKTGTYGTYYTQQKVSNARNNVTNYTWATEIKNSAVAKADQYVAYGDEALWYMVTPQSIPRSFTVNIDGLGCPNCGTQIFNYGGYPWTSDFFNDPWKITCPSCSYKFPTNNFAAYYQSGLNKNGIFDASLTESDKLVNTLYPSRGTGWGVDNSTGWIDSNSKKFAFAAYYNHWILWYGGVIDAALNSLRDAYIYTGENKYAHAGIILLDRIADVYPDMNIESYPENSGYFNSEGGTGHGKILGCIWETSLARDFAQAYDAFYPVLATSDEANIVPFLSFKAQQNSLNNPKDSIAGIKRNIEDNILRVIYPACQNAQIRGNDGMHQSALAMAAVVLDEVGTSNVWLDWVFKSGGLVTTYNPTDYHVTGGDINRTLIDRVDRDGYGDEAGPGYNILWLQQIKIVADVVNGYQRYPVYDLYNNSKFVKLFYTNLLLTMLDEYTPSIGDSGNAGGPERYLTVESLVDAYLKTGDPYLARYIYFMNGNKTEGIHTDIFSSNPNQIATDIESVITSSGKLNPGSENLTGYGFTALRDGIDRIGYYGTRYGFIPMSIAASSGKGTKIFTSDEMLQYESTAAGQYVTFSFNVATAGTYDVYIKTYKGSYFGICDIYLDNMSTPVKSGYDFYGYNVRGKYEPLVFTQNLNAGTHQIKFAVTGKNAASSGYKMGLIELSLFDSTATYMKNSDYIRSNEQRGVTLYYGRNNVSHAHRDSLNLGVYAFGLDMAPDLGYPPATGADPVRIEWISNTSSHNTVMLDKSKQGDSFTGIPRHFEDSNAVKFMDVEAPNAYAQASLYRRSVAMVKVDDYNSYTLDIFRVNGGNDQHYFFHGPQGSVSTSGLTLVHQSGGTYAGANVGYGQRIDGSGFQYLDNVDRSSSPQGGFSVEWDATDTWGVLPQTTPAHDPRIRLTMLNANINDVALVDGKPAQNSPGNPSSFRYMIAHRSGTGLNTQFVSLIEPYDGQRYIDTIQTVSMTPASTNATAVKVTLKNGRVDYIVNALDPTVQYRVDNRFDFKGVFALYSEQDGKIVNAYLSDGTLLRDGTITYNTGTLAALTGSVTGYTTSLSSDNQITINLNQGYSNINSLVGRYIYITNNTNHNAVYRIKEIKSVNGNTVSFGIGDATLINSYADPDNFNSGFNYDIATGNSVRIPVAEKMIFNLDLTSNATGMGVGSTNQFLVKGTISDGTIIDLRNDPNTTLTYSSDNTAVATVSTTGLVTAVSTGIANISVTATRGVYIKNNKISMIVNSGVTLNDGFENGSADWNKNYGDAKCSNEQKRSGSFSIKLGSDLEQIQKNLANSSDGVVQVWFYDDGTFKKKLLIGTNDGYPSCGPYYDQSTHFYSVRYSANVLTTSASRGIGWHQAVFDYTENNIVKVYIDGVSVAQITGFQSFNEVSLGDYWDEGCISDIYFDDISVFSM